MYCTINDIKDVLADETLKRLTDPDALEIDEEKVSRAADFAQILIDAHLLGAYELPIGEPNGFLRMVAQALAVYHLYVNSCGDDTPDYVVNGYQAALLQLKQIQLGELNLNAKRLAETLSNKTHADKLFPKEKLEEM